MIHESIIFLLENAPLRFHLLLISHADPHFVYALFFAIFALEGIHESLGFPDAGNPGVMMHFLNEHIDSSFMRPSDRFSTINGSTNFL